MSDASSIRQQTVPSLSGYFMFFLGLALVLGGLALVVRGAIMESLGALGGLPLVLLGLLTLAGLYMLQPNEAVNYLLFGKYVGSNSAAGLRWQNPFYQKRRVSLRARNLASEKLKVNDKRGNPIEIAAAIVWNVADSARALFNVEDYEGYVRVQSEAALRHLANTYAYDEADDGADGAHPAAQAETTLRGGQDRVVQVLVEELRARLALAGVEVTEARLTHLAYAPEIAQVMLRRQQAEAIIAARSKIVDGAVSMVKAALDKLQTIDRLELDGDRKAAMVSNLLVVLCSDRDAQPVVNAGTLYQ